MQHSPQFSPVFVIGLALLGIAGFTVYLGPTLLGLRMAASERDRLHRTGADPGHINPAPLTETFVQQELSPAWSHVIINGQGKQIPFLNDGRLAFDGLQHHITRLHAIPGGGLSIAQERDPDFQGGPLPFWKVYFGGHYNNAALVGMAGFQPTPREDVILDVEMQASPDFYGSAGAAFEPLGTLQPDGNFKDGIFSMFGVAFLGPNSSLHSQRNLIASLNLNWWPEQAQELPGILITERHVYTIRLRWVNEKEWLGIIAVDGREYSRMRMPPLGPLEVQLWGDNYLLHGDSAWLAPTVSQENGNTKSINFYRVSLRTEGRDD